MEIQKSILGPEKNGPDFFGSEKILVGPEKISLDQKNMFKGFSRGI